MKFNPSTPTYLQKLPWTCAIGTVIWMLRSLGLTVEPEDAYDAMVPRYVNSEVGLRNASGAGIVAVLRDHWGVTATNDGQATFDEVATLAGVQPVAIGLRNWSLSGGGHWSAVRGLDSNGALVLANPAGTGPVYGQQTLSRAEFNTRGPASLVTIPLAVAPSVSQLRGVDVSSHQGTVQWPQVAGGGISFAITKATGGAWYTNPTLGANWLGIKAAGLARGAYHYAFESSGQTLPGDGPEAEADYFVAALKRAGGIEEGDLLALDIEEGDGALGDWCLRWLRRVEALTGVKPFVYTNPSFSAAHGLGSTPALADYPLWLAAYQASQPPAPRPWPEIAIWQHSDNGAVPGISTPVDLDRFNGSREALLALGKGGAVAQSPAPSDPRDEQISGLVSAVAYLADDVAAIKDRDARLAEARRVREQYVGPKPAA